MKTETKDESSEHGSGTNGASAVGEEAEVRDVIYSWTIGPCCMAGVFKLGFQPTLVELSLWRRINTPTSIVYLEVRWESNQTASISEVGFADEGPWLVCPWCHLGL